MRRFKCLSVDTTNMRHFTIGKIYETDDNMLNYRLDGGDIVSYCPLIDVERGLVFEEIKEKGENKMEDLRELIKPCMVVRFRDGRIGKVEQIVNEKLALYDVEDSSSWMNFDYNKDLTFLTIGWEQWDILEIYGYSHSGNKGYATTINSRPLIWKRTEISPTQLKLEELEKKQREIADEMEKLRKEL